jgi:hypothetical protein
MTACKETMGEFGQSGYEDSRRIERELTEEPPVTTGRGSSKKKRHWGKCHTCREEGHRA